MLSRRALLQSLSLLLATRGAQAQGSPTVRIGFVRFGTAAWELDAMRRHRLAEHAGLDIQPMELASSEAGKIALKAGAVDVIVADWVWAMRQRAAGDDLVFLPYSRAVGSLEAPAGSALKGIADLSGKRIGVAGGALDKNWILLRALSLKQTGRDLADEVEPVFAAPPLLEREFQAGRLDAALTFWNFAARLEAAGARALMTVPQMLAGLGVPADLPMLGYVFRSRWARDNAEAVRRFASVTQAAKALLARSDAEWQALGPLLGTEDPAIATRLRDGYRAGIPGPARAGEAEGMARLYAILARLGGEALVGSAARFDPAIRWQLAG